MKLCRDSLLLFKVTLNADSGRKGGEPPFREIVVRKTQSLSTLARAIVEAFGFNFDHAYGFYDCLTGPYKSKEIYELFTDLGEEPTEGALGVERVKVSQAFPVIGKKMLFLFDYGDDWNFVVELLRIESAVPGVRYPRLLKSVGEAPEQYPFLEEDSEWEHFDDCAVCRAMKKAEEEGRSLDRSQLLQAFKEAENKGAKVSGVGVGDNDPCPCGSGKKYKKCHGRK